ncbi:unnamed protein product [Adineta ricciae]|uniref:Histone acetyltransferase n=1 Tax=Adineta ricciae TaxID=249248 RepID=A0A814NBB2_ADIRI|nr:unnamed protein product [Adineta ricciae]
MSQNRKSTQRKTSRLSTDSNNPWQIIDQPPQSSSSSSTSAAVRRPMYPNVPKRTQRLPSINEHALIQTDSSISFVPKNKHPRKSNDHGPTANAYTRLNLDLINNENQITRNPKSKFKRTISALDEMNEHNHDSKRAKSSDEDEDEDELSQLLDHRHTKRIFSQSAINDDDEERKPPVRKPTARKLSSTQQRPFLNNIQTQPVMATSYHSPETLMIEPDLDTEDDHLLDQEDTRPSHNSHTKLEDLLNRSLPTDVNLLDSLTPSLTQSSIHKDYHSVRSPLFNTFKRALEPPIDHSSPCSNGIDERQSTTSSVSLFYDTPRSSLSRTTTSNTNSTPSIIIKHDRETQISVPSNIDLIEQLILQTNLHINENSNQIDYNPNEIAKKFFHQCKSFSTIRKYPAGNISFRKQFLHFGRYEIEVEYPIDNDKMSTIYACDSCLKHFFGSSIAYQRHLLKCLSSQPPGKLVYKENDLAIFEIGKTKMTMEQCIYIKSLHRITRLFLHSTRTVDDRNTDRFTYYILCRRDPILAQSQSSIYRFLGYFSKENNEFGHILVNNLSCLTILPPFIRQLKYSQLLISFSYFLIRSNASTNQMFSTPTRPIDNDTLACFRNYWRHVIFAYFDSQKSSHIQTVTLDSLARKTTIHPHDILSTLYVNKSIITCLTDKSTIYLRNDPSYAMPCLNELLLKITEPVAQNKDKRNNYDQSVGEIILD